ncbi:hypothetical protein EDD71_103112 [Fonticella tunisiensis]|uniref:Uncharacterized protein n=1 Tax=Fonticella tunisiensis TaxID=1096341 RepID=A0A4R7KW39_9CLOT|nr:hypothetical protein EDD71_103112 [Fonticella tunisiensis]
MIFEINLKVVTEINLLVKPYGNNKGLVRYQPL